MAVAPNKKQDLEKLHKEAEKHRMLAELRLLHGNSIQVEVERLQRENAMLARQLAETKSQKGNPKVAALSGNPAAPVASGDLLTRLAHAIADPDRTDQGKIRFFLATISAQMLLAPERITHRLESEKVLSTALLTALKNCRDAKLLSVVDRSRKFGLKKGQ